jgi:3-hydroxyacyl-[acyl-carrier-protein] dehydratase
MSIENAKFRKPVTPGDQLRLEMTRDRKRGNVWRFNGVARVNGVTVAEAAVTAMIMDEARTA